jgi:hypothetical protein
MNEGLKKSILAKLTLSNLFIRSLEEFAKEFDIDVKEEKIYIVASTQRKVLRELIDNNSY